ncbi:MAG: serine/threonine-protein kinase [Myxococcales bacterium]
MEPVPASAVPGTRLGRYTLLGKLATGGMAEVFLARQDGPQGFAKTVVIKKILPHFVTDAQFVQMFLNEARLAALINHPNVVSIYELGEDASQETYYMAMEYIDGCNLRRLAQGASEQKKPLPPALAARIVADAAAGLDFAHNLKGEGQRPLNIVHRDISPENILLTYSGLVKVVDFGIAKAAASEGKTRTGQIKGKVAYMSPEQILGQEIDRRTDVWALGVTLYWLLGGARPFRGPNEAAIMNLIVNAQPPDLPANVPAELGQIVSRALAKDREARLPTAAALQGELERHLASGGQNVTTSGVSAYMNDLFPEASDPDRLLTRAILSGELRQMLGQQTTPSRSRSAFGPLPAKTVTASRPPESRRRWPLLALPLLAVAGGALTWIWYAGQAAPPPPPVGAQAEPLHPEPAPPAPATLAAALPPVPIIAAAPPPEPPPAPASPVKSERSKHTRSHLVRESRRGQQHLASAAPAVPAPAAAPEAQPPDAPSGPPGRIVIRVLPWASVYIDGRMVGTTPFEPIELRPGRHHLELTNDELRVKRSLQIDIKPGETTTIQEKLE